VIFSIIVKYSTGDLIRSSTRPAKLRYGP